LRAHFLRACPRRKIKKDKVFILHPTYEVLIKQIQWKFYQRFKLLLNDNSREISRMVEWILVKTNLTRLRQWRPLSGLHRICRNSV